MGIWGSTGFGQDIFTVFEKECLGSLQNSEIYGVWGDRCLSASKKRLRLECWASGQNSSQINQNYQVLCINFFSNCTQQIVWKEIDRFYLIDFRWHRLELYLGRSMCTGINWNKSCIPHISKDQFIQRWFLKMLIWWKGQFYR